MIKLDDLIDSAEYLCTSLEHLSLEQRYYVDDIGQALENMSYDLYKIANNLRQIKQIK